MAVLARGVAGAAADFLESPRGVWEPATRIASASGSYGNSQGSLSQVSAGSRPRSLVKVYGRMPYSRRFAESRSSHSCRDNASKGVSPGTSRAKLFAPRAVRLCQVLLASCCACGSREEAFSHFTTTCSAVSPPKPGALTLAPAASRASKRSNASELLEPPALHLGARVPEGPLLRARCCGRLPCSQVARAHATTAGSGHQASSSPDQSANNCTT
mmetsp:Transcript_68132/g.121424  ORF Transcript_68132/g.121424 Transcript_68132/m.121424 type:complete len:215 (+) Transcript_68132:424-1068(+)